MKNASLIRCQQCKKKYPAHLFGIPICPLCALENRNAAHGLPADTPFHGEIAAAMHAEAVEFDKGRRT